MPDRIIHISMAGDYKPGDPPPSGYMNWHDWAAVQTKSGLQQEACGICSRFRFPQELSGRTIKTEAFDRYGNVRKYVSPVCKVCDTPSPPAGEET